MSWCLRFGPFQLDTVSRTLTRGGARIHLTNKAYDLLAALIEARGAILSQEALLGRVWPEGFVEPTNLSQTMYLLRRALGEEGARYIETVRHRGYRWSARTARNRPPA